MNKISIYFDKNKKFFKVSLNQSIIVLNLKMFVFKSSFLALPIYNFLFILRILSRLGFIRPLKKF